MADNKVGEAFVELRVQLDRLQGDMTAARREIERHVKGTESAVNRGFSGLGRTLTAPLRGVAGLMSSLQGQAVALAGAFGGIAIGRSIVQTNVEFERLSSVLKTVTGSAAAGQKAFADLEKFAAATPNSLQDVTEAFLTLKARGIDASIETLNSFGDTAAAMGKPLKQFAEAVADATTGEMERLKEFGISAQQEGDKVAFTFDGVTTVVGKNAQEITAYLKQIGETKFAGAQADQMKTLGGLFSNLGDQVAAFSRQVGESGLIAGLKEFLKVVLDVQGAAGPLARTLGEVLGGALTRLAGFLREALDRFNSLSPEMQAFVVKATALAAVLVPLAPALGLIVAGLAALATPVGAAVIAIGALGAAYIAFKEDVDRAVGEAAARVSTFWERQKADFKAIGDALGVTGDDIAAFGRGVADVWSNLSFDPSAVTAALGRFGEEIQGAVANVVERARTDISAIGDAFGGIVTGLDDLVRAWSERWAQIRADPSVLLDDLAALIPGTKGSLDTLRANAAAIFGQINDSLDGMAAVVRRFRDFWNEIWSGIGIGSTAADELQTFNQQTGTQLDAATGRLTGFVGLWNQQWAGVRVNPQAITDFTTWITDVRARFDEVQGALGGFVQSWTNSWDNVRINPAVVEAVQAFVDQFNGVVQTLERAGERVREFWDRQVQELADAADGLSGAGARVKAFWDRQVEDYEAFGRAMAAAGERVTSFWNQQVQEIRDFAADPKAALADLGRDAKAAVSNLFAGVQAETGKLQQPLAEIQGFNEGVKASFAGATDAVVGRSSYVDLIDGVGSQTARLDAVMVQPINGMLGQITGLFGQAANDVGGDMKALVNDVAKAAGSDPAKKFGWVTGKAGTIKLGAKGATGQSAEAKQRQERVKDLRAEIDELQRLSNAQNISAEEYKRVSEQIAGERAARQLGLDVKSKEGQAIAALTIAQDRLNETLERARQIEGLEAEVAGLQRLNAATQESAGAADAMQRTLQAEQAVRAAGLTLQDEQGRKIRDLTLAQLEWQAAIDASAQNRQLDENVAGLERVAAAARLSTEAGEAMAAAVDRENQVRQAGLAIASAEGQAMLERLARQDALNESIQRSNRINDLQLQVTQIEALNAAELQGRDAYLEQARAIEVLNAVRELGLNATEEEIRQVTELTGKMFDLQGAREAAKYDPFLGAAQTLQEYVESAQEYGTIAGDLIRPGIQAAEDDLANLLRTGKLTFDNLGEFAENFADQLIQIASRQIIANFVGALMGGFAGPSPLMAGGATGGGGRAFARGGVLFGPGIGAFANRVITRPTVFPMARGFGLMGELGAEAVMPLRRGRGGRLGVEVAANENAAAAAPGTQVQIIDQRGAGAPAAEVQRSRGPNGIETVRVLIRSELKRSTKSGESDEAMASRFGSRPVLKY